MAETSWPSPNHNSRNVTDQEYEDLSAFFSNDGVWGNPGSGPVVTAGVGLTVVISASKAASLRGHQWDSGTTDFTLAVTENTSSSVRKDWVVLRLDRSTWDVNAAVKAGTPGAGLPDLERSVSAPGVWEMPLAQVTVPPGATSVTVQRHELYIGLRNRPITSDTRPPVPSRGEIDFETDTGKWVGWDGSSWNNIYYDSGDLTLGSGFSTWVPDSDNIGRRKADVVRLRIAVRRVDSAFSRFDDSGSKIGTVPAAFTPSRYEYFAGTFTNGATGRIEVRTDGTIWVTHASSDVPAGETLAASVTYLV